jgi:hypothetical protein
MYVRTVGEAGFWLDTEVEQSHQSGGNTATFCIMDPVNWNKV